MGIDDVRVDWIRRCENSNIKAKIEWDLDLHDVTEHTTLKKFDNYTNQAKLSWTSFRLNVLGASLVIQWLRFHVPNAEGSGLISGQGTRSHMLQLRPSTARERELSCKGGSGFIDHS